MSDTSVEWCESCNSFQVCEYHRVIDWDNDTEIGFEYICERCGETTRKEIYEGEQPWHYL